MTRTVVDAFELLLTAERLAPRLEAAKVPLAEVPGSTEERAWLDAARERLETARSRQIGDLLTRALRLPELEGAKRGRARLLQGAIVDALEGLHSGICRAGGSRAPLLDVLFQDVKLPQLRKCRRDDLAGFCAEFEKRLSSTYARRMFATETYAPVAPAHQELRAAMATWRSVFVAPPPSEAEAQPLRDELEAAAGLLEVPLRQARLLAQAALLPTPDLLEATGLAPATKHDQRKSAGP